MKNASGADENFGFVHSFLLIQMSPRFRAQTRNNASRRELSREYKTLTQFF
jgi:hypothetical protein